jgi:hypothetical protein
MVIDWM